MVSAFITNVILHHRWDAQHNPPTYVNARHRRRSGKRHKWKVLDMGESIWWHFVVQFKSNKIARDENDLRSTPVFTDTGSPPMRSVFTAQFSSCFASFLISGLVTFVRQTDINHMLLPWPQLRKYNHYVPLWTGISDSIRNVSSWIFASIHSLKCACSQIEFKMDFKCCRCDSAVLLTVSMQQWAADCLLLTSESQGWNYSAWFGKCLLLWNIILCETWCICLRGIGESS